MTEKDKANSTGGPLPSLPSLPAAPGTPARPAPTRQVAPGDMHLQCLTCNRVYGGPFKERNPGRRVHHITAKGEMFAGQELEQRGLDDNVSHGYCPESGKTCFDDAMNEQRREYAQIRRQREQTRQQSAAAASADAERNAARERERVEQERPRQESPPAEQPAPRRSQTRFWRGRRDAASNTAESSASPSSAPPSEVSDA